MFRRFFQFSVPSALGVVLAALIATLAETAPHSSTLAETVAGAGFLLLFGLPLGIAVSLVGRGLVHAWELPVLLGAMRDERGASPRFAAWAIFLVLGASLLALFTFQGMLLLFVMTRINSLVALSAPIVVVGICLFLVAVSLPLVNLFSLGVSRIESGRARQSKSALFTPAKVALAIALLFAVVLLLSWRFFLSPSLGHLDISFVYYLGLFALGVVALPALYRLLPRARAWRAGVALVLCGAALACIASAFWTRYSRPYRMLEIWGETKLAGWAIDTIYDVQSLRVDMQIEGIRPAEIPGAKHPNVVLITIDTLRADQVPIYGGKASMPALEELAKQGAVFDHAFAPGNVTRRSVPSIATGLSPMRVRGRVVGWALRMDPRHIVLGERLFAAGYDTAGFFCCRSQFGRDHRLGLINGLRHVVIEYDSMPLAEKTVEWLKERKDRSKPLFLWTHYIEPHNWAQDHKPGAGARTKKERYQQSLAATDESLGVLLSGIREELGPETIIVVTADHGEGLDDHGVRNHSGSLYDTELRVPLVIVGPTIKPSRLQQATGLVDLAPTLLELAGFKPPGMPQMDGLSVAPELLGKREDTLGAGEAYSLMVADRSVQESQAAIMSGRYKLIEREGGQFELYDFWRDPGETKDIKEDAPELLAAMKARLERRRAIDHVRAF